MRERLNLETTKLHFNDEPHRETQGGISCLLVHGVPTRVLVTEIDFLRLAFFFFGTIRPLMVIRDKIETKGLRRVLGCSVENVGKEIIVQWFRPIHKVLVKKFHQDEYWKGYFILRTYRYSRFYCLAISTEFSSRHFWKIFCRKYKTSARWKCLRCSMYRTVIAKLLKCRIYLIAIHVRTYFTSIKSSRLLETSLAAFISAILLLQVILPFPKVFLPCFLRIFSAFRKQRFP